jgi:predicted deacylase
VASKKQGTIRQLAESAGSPIDFVSAAGSVRVPQDLISEMMFALINFLMHYGFVRAAEAN